jgi:hypothetical protein
MNIKRRVAIEGRGDWGLTYGVTEVRRCISTARIAIRFIALSKPRLGQRPLTVR